MTPRLHALYTPSLSYHPSQKYAHQAIMIVNPMQERKMHFNRKTYLVLTLFLLIIAASTLVISATGTEPAFSEQLTFTLDLDAPLFNYSQARFDDSSTLSEIEFEFRENKTIGIIIPKNSQVTKAEFNLTGVIRPYKQCVGTAGTDNDCTMARSTAISAIAVAEIDPSHDSLEIAITTSENTDTVNTIFITNNTGGVIWARKSTTAQYPSRDIALGPFIDNENESIVAGDYGINVYDISGNLIWNYSAGGTAVYSVAIGNLTNGAENELVYGDNNGLVAILNTSSNTTGDLCNFSTGSKINSLVISDIDEDGQNEILAASNQKLYILDSACNEVWNYTTSNYIINSIAVKDLLILDSGKEIILGTRSTTTGGKYYLINSTGNFLWDRTTSAEILSVVAGEFDYLNPGYEILGGTGEYHIQLLNSNGTIYWTYNTSTETEVSALALGNLSQDTGYNTNELVLGTQGTFFDEGNLQILNFDNFPTNITMDIGADAATEWNYTEGDGRLRNSTKANSTQILTAINSYIQNNCTQDLCTIPITFHSDIEGILEVRINFEYTYNASGDINYTSINYWTKTENIRVNESIIARAKNITFTDPALNITIKYININSSATQCGFDGENYTNATLAGINYCNISSRTPLFKSVPSENISKILWDDQMEKEIPVTMTTGIQYYTEGLDNYFWRKNINLTSNNTYTSQSFTNITANITLNDSSDAVRGNEYLNVTWGAETCNIIPSQEQSTCDTAPPETQMTCNSSTFYVCKKDTDSNGVFDFIKWIHPILNAIHQVFYQAGGESNLNPNLTAANVTPQENTWNTYFNYSIRVNDTENDLINITLLTYSELTHTWQHRQSKNITGVGTVWFNISLEKEMTGTNNKYKYLYQDFNATWSSPIHSQAQTSNSTGPNITKHNIEITEITGHNTDVIRGGNQTLLVVRINDTTQNQYLDETGVLCTFNITYDKTNFNETYTTTVNDTGHCNYTFAPNSTYEIGTQTWLVTVDPRYYFPPSPPVNWTLNVMGKLNLSLTRPAYNQVHTRNTTLDMTAHLINQYNEDINSSTIIASDYNCSWYFNNTYLTTTTINNSGYCNYSYNPNCAYARLKDYEIEVKLNYTQNPRNYTIITDTSQTTLQLKDNLTITIDSPIYASAYYKGETIELNSTINDTCATCSQNTWQVTWYKDLHAIKFQINETRGFARNNTPVIITGAQLESAGANLTGWQVNSTKITGPNSTLPNKIFRADGIYINTTSEIVFLVNLTPYSTDTYYLTRNVSQVSGIYTTSYIKNSGFEGNSKDSWSGDGVIVNDASEKGNNSLKIECNEDNSPHTITQALHPITTQNIKLWYKHTGEYNPVSSGIRVKIGTYLCEIPIPHLTGNFVNESWRTYTCSNESILNKENISITVYTNTTGNSELYIDHICIADNQSNCISEDYGIPDNTGITARELVNTTTTEDTLWTIPMIQPLGKRKITAKAAGDYYYTKENYTQIYIWGYSGASTFDYSSTGCDGNLCFGGSIIDLACKIIDANTTTPIYNYNVSFYDGATLLNTNGSFTDSQGYATYSWESSTDSGNHTISCNISDAPNLYYNASIPDSNSTTILIFNDNTNATLSFKEDGSWFNTTGITAYNLSKNRNDLINISILINNTGQSVVSSPEIIAHNHSNITIHAGKYSAISIGANHQDNIAVNISRYAPLGNTTLNVTLIWANNDTQFINQTITINVTNTTILDITNKTTLNYAIPYGGTKQIGNFTIEAYGNTPLDNIEFSLEDGNYQELQNWTITYSDESFDIDRFENQTITISVTVPSNATLLGQSFWAYIVANNTGRECIYPYERCTDRIKINITVIDQDWQFTPLEEITKTVGLGGNDILGSFDDLINITNLKNQNMTINISIINQSNFLNFTYIFNSTTYQLDTQESTFLIPPNSFANINITFNITEAQTSDTGTYTFNISIHNLDANSVPQWVNRTVTFTISALYVEIISPNATHQATDIVAGDILNFTLNVTYDGDPLNDTENTTFTIKISGQICTGIQKTYSTQESNWHLNCTAPQIPENTQNNTVEVTTYYNTPDSLQIAYTTTEQNLVIYRDITSPYINRLIINSIPLLPENEANLKIESAISTLHLEVNATDNIAVKNVWMTITDPRNNITNIPLTQNPSTPDIWNCTYTNPNHLGDYEVTIYANDSIQNHTTTQTMWFDVYREIDFTDTLKDASDNTITADFELYKSGTDWAFHRFSTNSSGHYNWSTHKRTYDIKMTALGQIIRFNNFNITASAINKTGSPDPTSLPGAIKLHLIPNSTPETNASNIDLPNTAENILMAFIIHTPQTHYDNATVTMDYGSALAAWASSDENEIRLYYCTDWNFNTLVCGSEFTEFNSSLAPNVSENTFTFTTTHNSAYALARWCGGGLCSGGGGDDPVSPDGGGSSSGSSAGTFPRTVCGNYICETGENEQNCPEDCTYHVCGNGICEPTENKDNCPKDCGALDFEYQTDTDFINIQLAPGENKTHTLTILNRNNNSISISVTGTGDILDYLDISDEEFTLPPYSNKTVSLNIHSKKDTTPDTYSGAITISSGASKQRLPVIIRISKTTPGDLTSLEMTIEMITKKITPKDTLRFHVMLYNLGIMKEFNVTLTYNIKEAKTENIVKSTQEILILTGNRNFRKSIDISDINPSLHTGQYFIEVTADYGPKRITATDTFEVVQSFWATTRGQVLLASILIILLALLAWYGHKRYKLWKLSKARYVFPLNFNRLPHADNSFDIGKIAETNKTAHFNPDDLTTHVLTSGSTGAGKSVAASVIVEEALKQKIPVVVFDPTAQWTGFVRPCKDNNLLRYYSSFGMRPEDAHPFPGMIFEVTDPHVKIDFKKYMNPGEITVFTLNKLKPGEYDTAVQCIIDTIFSIQWEESTTLKMLVVFDEVHRLLEKYGGKGGYISLEKACREFRKWGIGLVMCSQVYSDFKEAIQGNILTEIQLNTKSMADIAKVKEKYGANYSEKISRQGVGVGMVQNPRYNDGKPWFIQFRPTMHSPHKITEEELKLYKEFAEKLEKIETKIEKLKQGNVNTMDLELELKLAKTKLKQGQFKMAEIYVQSLLSRKILDMS